MYLFSCISVEIRSGYIHFIYSIKLEKKYVLIVLNSLSDIATSQF